MCESGAQSGDGTARLATGGGGAVGQVSATTVLTCQAQMARNRLGLPYQVCKSVRVWCKSGANLVCVGREPGAKWGRIARISRCRAAECALASFPPQV